MKSNNLPIGFWIKKADESLTNGINKIHSQFGLTRTDWQVLNTLKEGTDITKTRLMEIMQPFAEESEIEGILINFRNKKLLSGQASHLKLTEEGLEIHQECLQRQIAFRSKSMEGISEQDYLTTYSTLERLVANIENE